MKINLFAIGNPRDINTWSNVPYFFCRSLEKRGIEVNALNALPEKDLSYRLWNLLTRFLSKLPFGWDSRYVGTFRGRLNYFLVQRNVRKLARLHSPVDMNVFLTFSLSSFKYTSTPVVHYCDRVYEQFLEETQQQPTRRDHRLIEAEKRNLERAAIVLSLNEPCRLFIRDRYRIENVQKLKAGINLDKLEPLNPETLITFKESRRDILFIGRNAYRRGVDILVRAFRMFNAECGNDFRLQMVGITPEEFNEADEKVKIYPYLRKDDPRELAIYNELLASARLFVMPMRQGPLPGVIREAKWACTPVIISDIANAGERVTHEVDGILVPSIHPGDFALQMTRLVQNQTRWREMALEAHRSAGKETWDHTAGEFLKIFEAHTHKK